MSSNKRTLDALLRNKLSAFVDKTTREVSPSERYQHNWHIDLIADRLTRCYNGEITRLIISMPPRNLKSICASVAFPAWTLGNDPTARIICASYSAELSSKLARDCRGLMETPWYQRVFPSTRLNRSTEIDLETTKKGFRYTTSIGGSLTGLGANFVIIDDPIKPEDCYSATKRNNVKEWYDGTLYTRLDNKAEGVIILVMQRLHVDDLVAHVLEKDAWEVLKLPAIAEVHQSFDLLDGTTVERESNELLHPDREPIQVLEQIEDTIGNYNFSAQYQQQPIPLEGNLIKWSWFPSFDDEQIFPDRADHVVQSWDTASKASELANYSVCLTFVVRGDRYYLIDIFRKKLDFPDLQDAVVHQAQRFRAKRILIEDMASGTQLIQWLKRNLPANIPSPDAVIPRGEKVVRMSTQSAKIREGRVYIPRKADWLEAFHQELSTFPYGPHDDQVDALSQFLSWFDERNRVRVTRLLGF
ncbi:MAG: phage terminase large subunit [Gammaproteobacteria bacterium]|jgi:predicted phage terminase large subunit-like protein|nr:phage terminase large subunit [Gammaproteobacteria bacterium]